MATANEGETRQQRPARGNGKADERDEIVDAIDGVIERVKRIILERTKPGDSVIIAGIGNTIGIGQ